MKTLDSFATVKRKTTDKEKGEEETKKTVEKTKKISNEETKANQNVGAASGKFYSSLNDFLEPLDTWKEPLKDFTSKADMKFIFDFLKGEYEKKTIYPPFNLIFNAFTKAPFDKVRVVIIGQDPYPNVGEAMGLSFSVPKNITTPKSLVNIYKCLMNDPKIAMKAMPNHGDLTSWSDQGVFLLNATLTVEAKKANSHQKTSKWSKFTDYVIQTISNKKEHVVFLLWGNFAIQKKKLINASKHCIIESIHPSPLAQTKGDFTKCLHFSQANDYLEKNKLSTINWLIEKK